MMLRTQREKIMLVTVKSLIADLNGMWLRHRLDTYSRQLQSIAVQRENDFQVERILQKQISIIRSELRLGRRMGVMYEPVNYPMSQETASNSGKPSVNWKLMLVRVLERPMPVVEDVQQTAAVTAVNDGKQALTDHDHIDPRRLLDRLGVTPVSAVDAQLVSRRPDKRTK